MNALISVFDKTGIAEFAKGLEKLGYRIISSSGTFTALGFEGVNVTEVSEITGFPECLDGRVKTLNPLVQGGILFQRDNPMHREEAEKNKIPPIDIVVLNLYPFKDAIAKEDVSIADAIKQIDIGGPTNIRAAAKNSHDVVVIVDPADYGPVLDEMRWGNGQVCQATKDRLMRKVWALTSRYDATINNFFLSVDSEKTQNDETAPLKDIEGAEIPGAKVLRESPIAGIKEVYDLRYGENPHQQALAAKIAGMNDDIATIFNSETLWGKELSYCNDLDIACTIDTLREFDVIARPACVIVKHGNPCGAALRFTTAEAYDAAFKGDPKSAYGGIIAFTQTVNFETARAIGKQFAEVVIAPGYTDDAFAKLNEKKNLRIVRMTKPLTSANPRYSFRSVAGGALMQQVNEVHLRDLPQEWPTRVPTPQETEDLCFAFEIGKHGKSNAVVFARNYALVGAGYGQPNRIGSAEIGLKTARESAGTNKAPFWQRMRPLSGAVMASDSFFPFPDCVKLAANQGVAAVVYPRGGGKRNEEEIVKIAKRAGIAIVWVPLDMGRTFAH
ncbi:MAG: bifunctional phosphoribosylaminoimidazolecarboxamide formyltransferase/IMP cyclohydrolase [Rickettsiales bacterium]|nr:bifunctional phosphoribosylaminoimidazolecarboxamide formyltransferase/IMP cyclohydrolase [Rickettsiales bacterium]